jgi:hypothetical protein
MADSGRTIYAPGDANYPRKATGAVYVTDYGLVGDGVADDTTAFQSFSTASSGKVVQADGIYAVTGSITNLHGPRYRGAGRVTRSGVTFYLDPSGTQTNTIYVSPSGNNANDGITSALPKQTLQAAFDAIKNYGPMLNGNWVVQLAAGTYPIAGNQAIFDTPSRNRVVIKGPAATSPAVPTAILDGAGGAAYTHGIRISGTGVQAEIRDIKAINFTAGGGDDSRIGFVGENGCDLITTNCHATGATWCGIYAFSISRMRSYGGILDGCRSGIVINDSPATIGASDAANVVYVRNSTESGIYWSRGSQGHIDYVTFEDNAVALLVAENSRVDTVANTFKRNSYAIRTQTGGVWGEGGGANIYGTGADVNPNGNNDFAYSGNNAELTSSTSPKRVGYDRTTRTVTGTTSLTSLTTPYTIAANRMVGAGKSCRVHAIGVGTYTAGTVFTVAFGGMSLALTVPAAGTAVSFEIDVTLHDVQGGYRAIGRIAHGLSAHRYGTVTSGFTSTSDQAVSISATPANVADTISIYRTDVYLLG